MKVNIEAKENTVIVSPAEKIDFVTAPDFEKIIEDNAQDYECMIISMENVDYISSAGLRALLYADNLMSEKNGLILKNVNSSIREILDISGFSNELKIE